MGSRILRGDVYLAELGAGIGYEQQGSTPVVIIQNDVGNLHSSNVIAAALSTSPGARARMPVHVLVHPADGMHGAAVVNLEQLRTLDKSRLTQYLGHLTQHDIDGLDRALRISVGLEPEYRDDSMLLTLCGICAESFFRNPAYRLCRADPCQTDTETCTVCNHRRGFDYIVQRRRRKR